MTNINKAFLDFDNNIKLSQSKRDRILTSRDAVRKKIKKYFSDTLEVNQPKFRTQGSFAIYTALNPIEDNEVDTDDGIYLQHVSDSMDEWPKPKDAHKLILDALENHTQNGCESKTSCVRIVYKNDYHLDLPIYIMEDDKAFLAQTKANEWQHSDSMDFRDWFYTNRKDDQTSRIIRYLKAWRDYRKLEFSSIELTILGIENFSGCDNRDDYSLLYTLQNIKSTLQSKIIKKPVAPFENLWEDLSEKEKENRIQQVLDLYNDLKSAVDSKSPQRASTIMRENFGDRFPLIKDEDEYSNIHNYSFGAKPWRY
jgi:hypothetical protein